MSAKNLILLVNLATVASLVWALDQSEMSRFQIAIVVVVSLVVLNSAAFVGLRLRNK